MRFGLAIAVVLASTVPIRAGMPETVLVGDAGNGADSPSGMLVFGAVTYSYRIGKTEVTNTQYAEFLNAVAEGPSLGLYDGGMGLPALNGGITRTVMNGIPVYEVRPGMENKPVNYVSWYDAIRFANWLNNGKGGPGTTEYGAYTLLGGTSTPSNANSIVRNPNARWALTSEDEWYKAAYYNPTCPCYEDFPTRSDDPPVGGPPPGGTNSANVRSLGFPSYNPNTFTDVGAYVFAPSHFGTFDQAGNVKEWNEALVGLSMRGARGSGFSEDGFFSHAGIRGSLDPTHGYQTVGFRVTYISVPEPSAILLFSLGGLRALGGRNRRAFRMG